ncbi:GxxExxY protein [Mangrovivirga sp. M17]|uniref:GxxExxY protein n=1 Tax=Mangrovivirga halotolerans TaxID=2993936 RepID=A0ABT3RPY4_9BACT|nr:GxxExxY protein [Mangrovivirga halotolerans]MCX2743652.1 GxxExxY protein [Mangrovivirga halotolerans]
MKHKELTHAVIGCAMKVHSTLGSGFQEVIYQQALAIELANSNIEFEREKEMDIFYSGECIGTRRVDFLIDGFLIVELKAISVIDDSHVAQTMNYCEAFDVSLGLLLNFGSKKLEFKRIYNTNHEENSSYNPYIL